jgi:hypothetical protein
VRAGASGDESSMEKPGLRHFCAGDVAKRSAGVLPCGPAPRRPALDGVNARTFVLICMKLEKSYSQLSKRFGLEGVFPTGIPSLYNDPEWLKKNPIATSSKFRNCSQFELSSCKLHLANYYLKLERGFLHCAVN